MQVVTLRNTLKGGLLVHFQIKKIILLLYRSKQASKASACLSSRVGESDHLYRGHRVDDHLGQGVLVEGRGAEGGTLLQGFLHHTGSASARTNRGKRSRQEQLKTCWTKAVRKYDLRTGANGRAQALGVSGK